MTKFLVKFTRYLEDDLNVLNRRRPVNSELVEQFKKEFIELEDISLEIISLYYPLQIKDVAWGENKFVSSDEEYIILATTTVNMSVIDFVDEMQNYYDEYGPAGEFEVVGFTHEID